MVSAQQLIAQPLPDDAYLYYRRTHNGELPPPNSNPSDHSAETTNVIKAPSEIIRTPRPLALLDHGVDPANLGKGDWIWYLSSCESSLGLPAGDVQGVIDYEKSQGMQWITVKCGDGGSIWTQFNSDLITRAHNAGLKIFGWAYAYGNDVNGEINVALNALNLGADGFIIDAETEYETSANRNANAAIYAGTIKANYPTRFLAHAPFPIISSHSGFPYVAFGTNCDAVMPQAYWADIGGTNYAKTMVLRLNSEWRNWQNSLSGNATNAIKPIVPIGQGYNSVNGAVDGTQISNFVYALKTLASPPTAGGYKGVSFWSCQHHSAAPNKWPAIAAVTIGDNSNVPPYFVTEPLLDRVTDTGTSVAFTALADGGAPFHYQWYSGGSAVFDATNSTYTLTNARVADSRDYWVVVTNAGGSVTSRVVSLTVYPPQTVIFADDFDSDTSGSWTVNKSSADTRISFNYDYASNGIASAPHSVGGTTRGVKFEANMIAGAAAALSLSPVGRNFAGDYRLHFDAWINVNGPFPAGGTGSTEFLTAGVGTAGNRVEWTGSGSSADGYWFSMDGEGGVSDASTTAGDYSAYIGTAVQSTGTGVYDAGTNASARGNGNDYYVNAIPGGLTAPLLQQASYTQQTGALNSGTAGFAWHDVIVSKRGSTVEWSVDGVRLAAISNVTFTANNIFLGYWDYFSSVSDNPNLSFGLVDNVRVEAPAQPAEFQFVSLQPDRSVRFTASGLSGATYVIETSTNLHDWTALTNLVATNGVFELNVGPATEDAQRFFRARTGP